MELVRIQKKDLVAVADEMVSIPGRGLAITPARARSQAANPFASPDDVLLLYVKDAENHIAGYAGILPGLLNGREEEKICWNSGWYADPRYGGQVSIPLLMEFLNITGKRVLFSDLTEKTAAVIRTQGEFVTRERKGTLLRLRSSLHKRATNLRTGDIRATFLKGMDAAGILEATDRLINAGVNARILSWTEKRKPDIRTVEFEVPSDEQLKYIRQVSGRNVTIPTREQVRWWMESRWLTVPNARNRWMGRGYYFGVFASEFRYIWVEVLRGEHRVGMALLTYRDGDIKTPYLWYDRDHAVDFFRGLFLHIIHDRRNRVIITFHEAFADYLNNLAPPVLKSKQLVRHTAIAGELASLAGGPFEMQDGDGDYLFT